MVFFFSSGPFVPSASCQAHSDFLLIFLNLSQTSARVRQHNVLMCNFLVSKYFFVKMILLVDGVGGCIGLGKKDGLDHWRCWGKKTNDKCFNGPYCYQCKNRGFVLCLSKQIKQIQIARFKLYSYVLILDCHLLVWFLWTLAINQQHVTDGLVSLTWVVLIFLNLSIPVSYSIAVQLRLSLWCSTSRESFSWSKRP